MIFYPSRNEILILPFSEEYAQGKILKELAVPMNSENKLFHGWIQENKFELNKKLNRPDNYSPSIHGIIEASSKGIIIFLSYRLMFSTRLYLSLWTIILVFFTIFFIVQYEAYTYATISILMAMVNYLIVYVNFRKQVKICHDLFVNVFNTAS